MSRVARKRDNSRGAKATKAVASVPEEGGCGSFMTMQIQSAPVSGHGPRDRIKPAEEVRSRWEWTEASVWTARMLTALEQGVKGRIPALPSMGCST